MTLNKRKNKEISIKLAKKLGSTIVLASFLAVFIIPASINAKNSQITYSLAPNHSSDLQTGLVWQESRGVGSKIAVNTALTYPDFKIRAVITAYTSTPDQTDDSPFIAATGKRVYDGMIAANGLPFGTQIKIPSLYGDKIFTVDDRMNARYGLGRMDIWMDAPRAKAMQFGLKVAEAEIYYPEYLLSYR